MQIKKQLSITFLKLIHLEERYECNSYWCITTKHIIHIMEEAFPVKVNYSSRHKRNRGQEVALVNLFQLSWLFIDTWHSSIHKQSCSNTTISKQTHRQRESWTHNQTYRQTQQTNTNKQAYGQKQNRVLVQTFDRQET